jgi:hypothetical protein
MKFYCCQKNRSAHPPIFPHEQEIMETIFSLALKIAPKLSPHENKIYGVQETSECKDSILCSQIHFSVCLLTFGRSRVRLISCSWNSDGSENLIGYGSPAPENRSILPPLTSFTFFCAARVDPPRDSSSAMLPGIRNSSPIPPIVLLPAFSSASLIDGTIAQVEKQKVDR